MTIGDVVEYLWNSKVQGNANVMMLYCVSEEMQVVGTDVRGMLKGESCHQHTFNERVVVGEVVRGAECQSGRRWDYSDSS